MNKALYSEGRVRVYTSETEMDGHVVSIGQATFNLPRGGLEQFAVRTQVDELERAINNYDARLSFVLKKEGLTPSEFALALSRARLVEIRELLHNAYNQISGLSDRISKK